MLPDLCARLSRARFFRPSNLLPSDVYPVLSRLAKDREATITQQREESGDSFSWIFGYGSLVWRPGFKFSNACIATLRGWERAFCQASPDHRGTPTKPGRVLTLRKAANVHCVGMAYQVEREDKQEILDYLDVRESGGYSRQIVNIVLDTKDDVGALTYIALPDNPHAVAREPDAELLSLVKSRHGPSGSNLDYVLNLSAALQEKNIHDPVVENLAAQLR
ncbi:MAG: gamma-glutamylcyclotransferase [Pseudomonadota bacterium]